MRKKSNDKGRAKANRGNLEWSDADFSRARRLRDAIPQLVRALKRGRPKLERPKVQVTLRLDAEIVDSFRARGSGWQCRINETLSRSLKKKRAAA